MPTTPQLDVSNSNIKQKQIVLLLEVVNQPKHQVDDPYGHSYYSSHLGFFFILFSFQFS